MRDDRQGTRGFDLQGEGKGKNPLRKSKNDKRNC